MTDSTTPTPDAVGEITLKNQLLAFAKVDREQTVSAMINALVKLGVVRDVTTRVAYDPLIIGSHDYNTHVAAQQIGVFLKDSGVLQIEKKRDARTSMATVEATAWVLIPIDQQPIVDAIAEKEAQGENLSD